MDILIIFAIAIPIGILLYVWSEEKTSSGWKSLANRLGFVYVPKRGFFDERYLHGDYRGRKIEMRMREVGGDEYSGPIYFTQFITNVSNPNKYSLLIKRKGMIRRIADFFRGPSVPDDDEGIEVHYTAQSQPDHLVRRLMDEHNLRNRFNQIPLNVMQLNEEVLSFEISGFDVKGSKERYFLLLDILCNVADEVDAFES